MALIKCKECGAEVSSEAKSCPKCGAKVKTKGMGFGAFLLLIFIIGIFASLFTTEQKPTGTSSTSAPQPPPDPGQIAYEVVEQRTIPNGGYIRAIVIDPKHRNEADMKKLAERLKRDTRLDRNAFVRIYDDKSAAARGNAAILDRLSKEELKHYDSHMIGSYNRNANTGYHSLTIMLEGVSGPAKEIKQ